MNLGFNTKKLLALVACGVMAAGIIAMPVQTDAKEVSVYTGDVTQTEDPTYPGSDQIWITGDAQSVDKILEVINSGIKNIFIELDSASAQMPKSVFEAAKENGVHLRFGVKSHGKYSEDGNKDYINYTINEIENIVDVNFGYDVFNEGDILTDLEAYNPLAFEFDHSGVLPGKTDIETWYVGSQYGEVEDQDAFLYYFNEETGKLEKQEQGAYIDRNFLTFSIDHCSTYVVTEKEIPADKLQVAEAKEDKTNVIKDTGTANGMKTVAVLGVCGAALAIASRKQKKA